MEIFRFNIVNEEESSRREQRLHELSSCPMCGTERTYEYRTSGGDILERTVCECCGHREEDCHPVH